MSGRRKKRGAGSKSLPSDADEIMSEADCVKECLAVAFDAANPARIAEEMVTVAVRHAAGVKFADIADYYQLFDIYDDEPDLECDMLDKIFRIAMQARLILRTRKVAPYRISARFFANLFHPFCKKYYPHFALITTEIDFAEKTGAPAITSFGRCADSTHAVVANAGTHAVVADPYDDDEDVNDPDYFATILPDHGTQTRRLTALSTLADTEQVLRDEGLYQGDYVLSHQIVDFLMNSPDWHFRHAATNRHIAQAIVRSNGLGYFKKGIIAIMRLFVYLDSGRSPDMAEAELALADFFGVSRAAIQSFFSTSEKD